MKKNMNDEIQRFIASHTSPQFRKALQVKNAWEKIASDYILAHTDNVVFSKRSEQRSLLIYVDSSQWAAEMSMQKEYFRIMMNQEIYPPIDDIIFLVSKKVGIKRDFNKKDKEEPSYIEQAEQISLSQDEYRNAREIVEQISDEKLRTRLFNAMIKDLEWKKGIENKNKP